MSEQNKAIVRRLIEEVWNKGNLSLVDEFFTPNYEHHDASTPDFGRGAESEKKRATADSWPMSPSPKKLLSSGSLNLLPYSLALTLHSSRSNGR